MTDYNTAADALGVPESILRRSAEARAKADGVGVDELVASWAGGSAPPAPSAPASAPVAAAPSETTPAEAPVAESAPPAAAPPATAEPPPPPRPTGPVAPPVLVGMNQGINGVVAGSVGILILTVLLAFLVPSLPQPANGVRSSNHSYTSQARTGRTLYVENGCGSCHTQLIRAVVADARLGPVTLSDSNQVFGYRRIGPDLSAIGARVDDSAAMTSLLSGEGEHPRTSGLDSESLAALLAYLREST